jgi:transcriptional regulator with XRE-family HTH domain
MARKTKRLPEGSFYRDLGNNLRVAREASDRSQTEVARFLDVTFQQVQKYENGTNRIPVDRLISLADWLEMPLSQFIKPSHNDAAFQSLAAQFGAKELHALLQAWEAIEDRAMRAALLNVIKRAAVLTS